MRVLARIARTPEGSTPYEARIIKRLGASAHRVLGVLRLEQGQPPRIEPIDRKTRYALVIDREELCGAKNGELVLAEPMARHGTGGPRGRIVERLGSMDDPKAVSLIAIHAHGIPTEFPREALQRSSQNWWCGPHTDLGRFTVTIDPKTRDRRRGVGGARSDRPIGNHIVSRHRRGADDAFSALTAKR
jgi:ribonuclease R